MPNHRAVASPREPPLRHDGGAGPMSSLARLGVVADLYVFGGAAMALAYDSRRATRDIDAVFSRTVWCWNRRACTSHQRSLTTLAYALPPHCQSTSWR